jgi:AGCS family alanine or glycine:cation symporter
MVGTLPVFQVNQLVQIIRDTVAIPNGLTAADSHFNFDLILGIVLAVIAFSITVGNVKRVSAVAGKMVPAMVIFYFAVTAVLLVSHIEQVPSMLLLIVTDAFSGQAVSGGVIGTVILIGVQRGAFSNEAGIGTESLAHGAAKTNEPAREGLVAMVGPIADTLIVCTCTALTLLVTGVWKGGAQGVTMAAEAYEQVFPGFGAYLLLLMVFVLSMTTVLTYWYYGSKCMGFLFGAHREKYYLWAYMLLIVAGSVVSLDIVINLLDGAYATMAIPTMVSTLLLAPKVKAVAMSYFARLDAGEFD